MLKLLGAVTTELMVPLPDVVDFDGDVRIRVVRGAHDPRVAIELLQRQKARGHPELRVEVFVAHEADQIAAWSLLPRRDTRPRHRSRAAPARHWATRRVSCPLVSVEALGVVDRDLRELAAQLQPIALVADVGLADANLDVERAARRKLDLPLQALAPSVRPGTPTYSTRPV